MFTRVFIYTALAMSLLSVQAVSAQDATPELRSGCTGEPRSTGEIEALMATPVADEPLDENPAGVRVDDATLIEIQQVILTAELCAQAGDFGRLAALYSDHAIQSGVLAAEDVPILPGTPEATPQAPVDQGSAPKVVSLAIELPDGRVLATIEQGTTISQVYLVKEDDRWLIDSGEVVVDEMIDDIGGSPSAETLPIEVLDAIVQLVRDETGEDVDSVTIIAAEQVEWPDAFLGCPVEGSFAAQVITPGYRVMVDYEGTHLEVHTDLRGNAVTC